MCDSILQEVSNRRMVRRWPYRVLFLGLGLSSMSGCNGPTTTATFGHDGYAIIQGEIRRASGDVFANGFVFTVCGQLEEGGLFGREGVTDEEGRYAVEMNAPTGTKTSLGIAPDATEFELTCEVRAGSPPFAGATAPVRFGSDPTQRSTTTIDLQEDASQ